MAPSRRDAWPCGGLPARVLPVPPSSPQLPLAACGPPPGPALESCPGGAGPPCPGPRAWLSMATAEDQALLHSLFQPHSPLGITSTEEEEEEEEELQAPPAQEAAFPAGLLEQAIRLEVQGAALAEAGKVDAALERFGQAIQLLPERASAYNNRAQALRLQGDVAGAMQDLAAALELSKGGGPVARQAFVQRALLRRFQGHDEAARKDFAQAARLGSSFARQQLVLMNPYAALCNQMLAAAMKKLRGAGSPSEEEEEPYH